MKRIFLFLSVLLLLVSCQEKTTQRFAGAHPDWSYQSVVYELNIRQATPEGTFTAATAMLPRLQSMGVDVIWLMPIHPIGVEGRKGTLGSYYAISDYMSVNPEFGMMQDFDSLLSTAHRLGMKVILDLVANHTSPDAVWAQSHKDWYVLDKDSNFVTEYDWTDIAKLNYENCNMQRAMIDVMKFWVLKGVDGYRCDMASLVPASFWKESIDAIKQINPNIYMLAEGEEPALHEAGFDATYSWEAFHLMNDIAQGKKPAKELVNYLDKNDSIYPENAFRLMFTSNHDENSWAGTEQERMGNAAQSFAALTYILPQGQPLIYTGQEVGFNRRFQFFEKDSVDSWQPNDYTTLYTNLNAIRHENEALASGEFGGAYSYFLVGDDSVFVCTRQLGDDDIVAIFNLSEKPAEISLPDSLLGRYTDLMLNDKVSIKKNQALHMDPWAYSILRKR